MAPLKLLEEDVTWVASNLSGDAGTLGTEAIDLMNCLLRFGCASEEFRVVVANMANWMATPPPPYHSLTAHLDRKMGSE